MKKLSLSARLLDSDELKKRIFRTFIFTVLCCATLLKGDFGTFLINLLLADIDLRKLYVALAAAAVAHIF